MDTAAPLRGTSIYMDYHATTPLDPRVLEAMTPYFTAHFGNAASRQHRFGWVAAEAVSRARDAVASTIGADARDIVFTSGATESNNLAIKGTVEARRKAGGHAVHAIHAITVLTEHKSVLDVFRKLERGGLRVTWLEVDEFGLVGPEEVAAAITPETVIVSVMTANSEIGTIAMLAEIGAVCRAKGIPFHTDATQAVGKIPVDVGTMNVDLLSMSAHKFYGPKGVGCLYVRSSGPGGRAGRLAAQIDGGGHENGMRSGTLNVPGIVGLGTALRLAADSMSEESSRVGRLRDMLRDLIVAGLPGVYLNGHPERRLPNNLNLSFEGVEDNALMLSMKEIAVSTGSACSSASPEPSHVLKALGIPRSRVRSAIRFGLGRYTTGEEVRYVARRVIETVNELRSIARGPAGPRGSAARHNEQPEQLQTTKQAP